MKAVYKCFGKEGDGEKGNRWVPIFMPQFFEKYS